MEKKVYANLGIDIFAHELEAQNQEVLSLKWKPPVQGDVAATKIMDRFLDDPAVQEANQKAAQIIMLGDPFLVDVGKAKDMIEGMDENTILHAGPPITWERMCGPMQGAIIGALIYEGRATNEREAVALIEKGDIRFVPCHSMGAVGPMAGIISPSMPVHVVENKTYGNRAYCTINEGLGKVLRFGANSQEVIERLYWIEKEFAPVLKAAVDMAEGGIDLKIIIAQAVQMGDECHNRNKAATSLFFKEIVTLMMETSFPKEQIMKAVAFIKANEHYFLNLSMPSCKSSLDPATGVEKSTVVTAMARNGVDFGIQVSGLGQDKWYTAPANYIEGLLFPGYTQEDANPDMGDSAITETFGIGGFAMGASPAIVKFVGGTVQDALEFSKQMKKITTLENSAFSLPPLDFSGSATGIDILKVLDKEILPVINTGVAHKVAGVGQIGAGIVHPPYECFIKALKDFE